MWPTCSFATYVHFYHYRCRIGLQMKIGERDRGFSTREPPAILSYDPGDVSRLLLVSEPDEYGVFLFFFLFFSQTFLNLSYFIVLGDA